MTWLERLKAFLKGNGVDTSGKTDAEIRQIAEKEGLTEPPATQTEPPPALDVNPTIAKIVEAAVKQATEPLLTALADEKAEKKKNADIAAAQAVEKRKTDIQKIISDAVKDGKIPADNKAEHDEWTAKFEANFDVAKFAVEKLPAAKAPAAGKSAQGGNTPKRGVDTSQTMDSIRQKAADVFSSNMN